MAHVQITITDHRNTQREEGPQSFQKTLACSVFAAIMDGDKVLRVLVSDEYKYSSLNQATLPYAAEKALTPIIAKLRPQGVSIRTTVNGKPAEIRDDWTISI